LRSYRLRILSKIVVDRGYENFEEKFKALGANIERIKTQA